MATKNLVLVAHFCLHHRVEQSLIFSLHEFGLIGLVEAEDGHYLYEDQLGKVEKIIRLHDELGINFEGIDVVNHLLAQIDLLQKEMLAVKNRLMALAPSSLVDDIDEK